MTALQAVDDYATIPQELTRLNQWVIWGVDAKNPKRPYSPKTMSSDDWTNPANWGTYNEAVQRVQRGQAQGVGFAFSGNGVIGVDLDNVFIDGTLIPEARAIIDRLDSFVECSQSGNGLHVYINAPGLDLGITKASFDFPGYPKSEKRHVEFYQSTGYFAMTCEPYGDARPMLDRAKQLKAVFKKYASVPPIAPARPKAAAVEIGSQDDLRYSEIGLEKDEVFASLWAGHRPNGNESSDDQALFNKLAYWCNGNEALMKNVFLNSPYYAQKDDAHKKKCSRKDYLTRTIQKAINGTPTTAREKDAAFKLERARKDFAGVTFKPPASTQADQNTGVIIINPFETPDARRRYSWDDIGCGNLFADTYQNISRYVPEAKSWYCYDGKVWRQDVGGMIVSQQAKVLTDYMLTCRQYIEDDNVREAWVDFVSKRIKRTARETMLTDAASVYPISILLFDNDPYIFNCQNCTLDLRNFKMRPHRATDYLSKISNVIFDKDAKCERWESFINEIMQGDADTAKFFQKALGYALTGDTSKECLFILYGAKTRNGKGTSMETALHLMGDYGRTAQPESLGQKHNANGSNATEDIARLKGARFVNMSEPDKGLRLNAALVKQMTGGDTMTARFLHQNSFEFKPEFKLFINTSHLPKVNDDSIFSSGRVKLIPFERHFDEKERDEGLKAFFRQPDNISGIFNWFIEGLKMFNSEGLKQPEAVANATNDYREKSDTIGLFIKDRLEPCGNHYIKVQDVYTEYSKWCDDFGYGAKNKSNFIDEINKKGLYKRHRTLGFVVYDYILKTECPFDNES